MEQYGIQDNKNKSNVTVPLAFRCHFGKPFPISAVVVNGELLANPSETTPLISIKILIFFLVPPPFALCFAEFCVYGRLTTVHVEVLVVSHKWPL
ncbi:hypothetical protein Hanom_Chr17g01538841 [Helianthus anomalus]